MEITKEYIIERFRELNKAIFNRELPLPDFQLLKSYSYCGKFSCKKVIGKRRLKGQRIEISSYYDWTEKDLDDVLVHEMLHYYLAYKHIDNNLTHGDEFKKYANLINNAFDFHITEEIDCSKFKKTKNAPKLSWVLMHIFG